MTHDPQAAALQQYHARFDVAQYSAIGEFLASNLNANRDDARVVDLLIALQNTAFQISRPRGRVSPCNADTTISRFTVSMRCAISCAAFHWN